MKLTADLILQSAQFTNALKDRELDLRGIHFVGIFDLVCIFSRVVLTNNAQVGKDQGIIYMGIVNRYFQ